MSFSLNRNRDLAGALPQLLVKENQQNSHDLGLSMRAPE